MVVPPISSKFRRLINLSHRARRRPLSKRTDSHKPSGGLWPAVSKASPIASSFGTPRCCLAATAVGAGLRRGTAGWDHPKRIQSNRRPAESEPRPGVVGHNGQRISLCSQGLRHLASPSSRRGLFRTFDLVVFDPSNPRIWVFLRHHRPGDRSARRPEPTTLLIGADSRFERHQRQHGCEVYREATKVLSRSIRPTEGLCDIYPTRPPV